MEPKYSENALLKVCYAMAAVIVVLVGGISYCINSVLKHIT